MNSYFEKELQELINKHNMESDSGTPDFMLARYLTMCLHNYEHIIRDRDRWYDHSKVSPVPAPPSVKPIKVNDDVPF